MKTSAILRITLMGLIACGVLGLPIEKELLRVKRKGELDDDEGGHRLHRRDLTPDLIESLESDLQVRRKRRFEPEQTKENSDVEKFPNKMAARSSRSSREDNDVTARGMERFLIREVKNKGIKQPAKRFISTSGSGLKSDVTSSSGSGVWISDAEASNILSRGVSTNVGSTLENIVASLGESDGDSSSGSGTWAGSGYTDVSLFSTPVSQAHFAEVGRVESGDSSGTGEKPTSLVSDLSEELKQQTSKQEQEHPKQKRSSETDQKDILHQFFEGSQIIHRARREKIDNGLEERLASFFKNLQGEAVASHQPDTPHEPPPIPAVVTSKRKSKVTKTARDVSSTKSNGDVLTGINLVKRFYKDQGMKGSTREIVFPDSVTPLGEERNQDVKIETKELEPEEDQQSKDEDEGYPVDSEDDLQRSDKATTQQDTPMNQKSTAQESAQTNDTVATNVQSKDENSHEKLEESPNTASNTKPSDMKRSSIFEPRVLSEKQIPKTHVTIIEEPAVYSNADNEMDSDDGGRNADEDDESEPAIEIHERDIREDGYVGCYADRSPDRDLPVPVSVRNITPTTCRMACKDHGHAYAGLQYGYLCRCGDNYGKYQRLAEEQCSTACKGDKTQICGGFFRSSIYATEGVTEPTQGEFLHVESVRPLNAPIRSQSTTSNYMPPAMPYLQPNPLSYRSAAVQQLPAPSTYTSYIAPQEPKIIYHSETPIAETPGKPVVKNEVTKPPKVNHHPHVTMQPAKKSTIAKPVPKPTPSKVIRKPHYLHKQVAAVVKKSKKGKPEVNVFGHLVTNPATQIFTGSIKLKQNWLDNLDKPDSPAYNILSGNIEEAFKKMFKKDPKFISAKVHRFRKGLVKHNPATIRKVIASFSLTFQRGANGIEDKVAHDIKKSGKLFDMPAFNNSIKIKEYNKMPIKKPKKIERKRDTTAEEKRDKTAEEKRDTTAEEKRDIKPKSIVQS